MTEEEKKKVVAIIESKVDMTKIDGETIVFGVDEVEQYIKNYCNISSVPFALRYVMANMVVDLLNYQYYKLHPETADTTNPSSLSLGDISDIKVGDTQVKLGSWGSTDERSTALKAHTPQLDEVLFNYNAQLNQFRRLY